MKESSNDSLAVLGLKSILGLSVGDLNLRPNTKANTEISNNTKKTKNKKDKDKSNNNNNSNKNSNNNVQTFDDASEALKAILLGNKPVQVRTKRVEKKQNSNSSKNNNNKTNGRVDGDKLTKAPPQYFATASLFAPVSASEVPQPVFNHEEW